MQGKLPSFADPWLLPAHTLDQCSSGDDGIKVMTTQCINTMKSIFIYHGDQSFDYDTMKF
jgi:hypothetical protein